MKVLLTSVLCLGSLYAQSQQPHPTATLPNIPNDKVVAGFDDGSSMTMGDLRALLTNFAPQEQQQAIANLQAFLDQWALFRKLEHLAEEEKLDQKSPVKDQLAYGRTSVLAQAEIQEKTNEGLVPEKDVEQYYETTKAKYIQVKVDAIYVAFSNSAAAQKGAEGKKMLSQDEARAKITKLRDEVRNGADFKKLARENSDDEVSRAKDGYFGVIGATDTIPDALKAAVLSLKPGEITDVLSQPNGFYLFRAEDATYKPYKDVRDEVYNEYRLQRFKGWFDQLRNQTKAHVLDPALIAGQPAAGAKH